MKYLAVIIVILTLSGFTIAQSVVVKDSNADTLMIVNDEGANKSSLTIPESDSAPDLSANKLYNINGTLNWNGSALGTSTVDGHSLDADDGDPIDAVYVRNNGNVGIGTTQPSDDLHIVDTRATVMIQSNFYATYGSELIFRTEDSFFSILHSYPSFGDLYFNNYMIIKNGGNVGINNNNPAEQLSVTGIIESTSGGFKFPDGTIQLTAGGSGGGSSNSLDAADGNPAEAVFVDNDGKVGVGTTNPEGAMDIQSIIGGLIVPRLTVVQRNGLPHINGTVIYNTSTDKFNFYENGEWYGL